MNFSKLKLVSEMYAQQPGGGAGSLAGTKLSQAANNKASEQAQAPKKVTNTSNNIGMQAKQMSQKTGNIQSPNVQKPGGAPAKAATTGSQMATVEDYFDSLRSRKEFNKLVEKNKSDWKSELKEALGADDEVFHPYVEVMPFKDFKQNEAKKNLAKQAMEPGAAENPAQKKAKKDMLAPVMGESTLMEGEKEKKKAMDKKSAKEDKKKRSSKKISDLEMPHAKRHKSTLRKISAAMKASRDKARQHSRKAKSYFDKHAAAAKKGDEATRKKYSKLGHDEMDKARAAKTAHDRHIPYGSKTYAKASRPSEMNSRFFRDRESDKGRQKIALRSLGL